MDFPHKELDSQASMLPCDFRSLLSGAISRQGNSHTARAMMLAQGCHDGASAISRDKVGARIHYFASAADYFNKDSTPHGSFLPTSSVKKAANSNYEDAVYQAPSINSKNHLLSNASFETQTDFAGQETLRTL